MSSFATLKGIARDGWYAHHILPRQCANDISIGPILRQLKLYGLDLNDFRTNGVLLPASVRLARETGLPLHSGPHKAYSNRVMDRVRLIVDPNRHTKLSVRERSALIPKLTSLQRDLRWALLRRHEGAAFHIDEVMLFGATDPDIDRELEARWPDKMAQT